MKEKNYKYNASININYKHKQCDCCDDTFRSFHIYQGDDYEDCSEAVQIVSEKIKSAIHKGEPMFNFVTVWGTGHTVDRYVAISEVSWISVEDPAHIDDTSNDSDD